jgi:tRNA G18 (ribose-2'-O)-methylase SpoU
MITLCRRLDFYRNRACNWFAVPKKPKEFIYKPDYTAPTAIIMGSEEDGVRNDIIRIADHLAKIPMYRRNRVAERVCGYCGYIV